MIYGYLRTARNNEEQITEQRQQIVDYCKRCGFTMDICVAENGSGLQINKGLQFILDNLQEGDMLIMIDISRLSRDIDKCMELIKSIEDKGIELITLDNGLDNFAISEIREFVAKVHNR